MKSRYYKVKFSIKKHTYLIICILLFTINLRSQTYVEKIFDFDIGDQVSDIIKLEGDGLLILGMTNIDGIGKNVFIRLNNNGDSIWTKVTNYYGYSIVQYDNSSFYIAAGISGVATLTKLDNDLNKIWKKTYPYGYGPSKLNKIQKSHNSQLIANYYFKWDIPSEPPRECLNAYDSTGAGLWSGNCYMVVDDIEQMSNDNYIRAVKSHYAGDTDFAIIEDSLGEFVGRYKFEESSRRTRLREIVLVDDTAIIIGTDRRQDLDNAFINIFKLDTDSISLQGHYSFFDSIGGIFSGCKGLNNSVLVTGNQLRNGRVVPFIFTFNSSGDSISTSYIDKFYNLSITNIISYENSFYAIGTIYNEDESQDIYFLKAPLDTVLVSIDKPVIEDQSNCVIYPIPATNKLFIKYSEPRRLRKYKLFSSTGQLLHNKQLMKNEIDVSDLRTGLYIIKLEFDHQILTRKLLIK